MGPGMNEKLCVSVGYSDLAPTDSDLSFFVTLSPVPGSALSGACVRFKCLEFKKDGGGGGGGGGLVGRSETENSSNKNVWYS